LKSLVGIIGMLFLSFILFNFPKSIVLSRKHSKSSNCLHIEYPQGIDIEKTNKATLFVENQILDIMKKYIDPKSKENYLQVLTFK
jgi:hypothetical protein